MIFYSVEAVSSVLVVEGRCVIFGWIFFVDFSVVGDQFFSGCLSLSFYVYGILL